MRRREFITLLVGAAAWPLTARAQQPGSVPRIGVLWHSANAEDEAIYIRALVEGFEALGYVDGRNIKLVHRFANQVPEKFASMAAELASRSDVLLTSAAAASMAAKDATSTVPVVFIVVPDPVGSKLVDSLARPGGNVTGLSNFAVQLSTKRVEYLKEAIPSLSRLALLINPSVEISRRYVEEGKTAADRFGLTIQLAEARSVSDLELAFDAMVKAGAQAVAVNAEGVFFAGRKIVAKLALARGLPSCVYSRETLEAGALMSYGPDQRAIFRRAAAYADKILKGTKPADLPVEQPTKFEFLINLKTAKALGLTIPATLLARADELIE